MATTSSSLAGKPIVGQGGSDKGNRQRVAAVVAAATLGLSLLIGGVIGQARQASVPTAPQTSTNAVAGARPVDVSTTGAYRWDFGSYRPIDASVVAEYRWDFDGSAFLSPSVPAQYRVSAPNELNADGSTPENAQP